MAGEELDYTPRPERGSRPEGEERVPPASRKRSRQERIVEEGTEDYTPRQPRRGRKARALETEDYTPRPARRSKKPTAESSEYMPRPPRREKERQPALWQRQQAGRGAGYPRRERRGRFFGSKTFWRITAVGAILIMVVPGLLVLTRQAPASQDPQLARLLDQLEQNPDDFFALRDLGDYFYDVGIAWWDQEDFGQALTSFESAANYYERALQQDPAQTDMRTDLGTMFYYQGQLSDDRTLVERAIQEWQVALFYEPDKPETLFNLGIGFVALNQVEQAVGMWQRVIEVAPGTSSAEDAQRLIEQYGGGTGP